MREAGVPCKRPSGLAVRAPLHATVGGGSGSENRCGAAQVCASRAQTRDFWAISRATWGGRALVVLGYMFREIRIQPSTVGPRTPWEAARGPDGGAGERWPCVISLFIVGISLSSSASPRAAPPGLTTELESETEWEREMDRRVGGVRRSGRRVHAMTAFAAVSSAALMLPCTCRKCS